MKHFFLTITFFLIWAGICSPALSAEPLVFKEKLSISLKDSVEKSLNSSLEGYVFSSVDLNKDGQDELILKEKKCSNTCKFKILGLSSEGNALMLLEIMAKSILISDNTHLGIRDLLIHNHPDNDFATSLYIWDTQASRYILKE